MAATAAVVTAVVGLVEVVVQTGVATAVGCSQYCRNASACVDGVDGCSPLCKNWTVQVSAEAVRTLRPLPRP